MKYEEIVKKVTQLVKKLDVSAITEHIALQIDIVGEGEGAFYVEAADGKAVVEPYEYYDRDCKLVASADDVIALFSGKLDVEEAFTQGSIRVEGNADKAKAVVNAPKKKTTRKPAAKKTAEEKAPAKKETKKPAAKKAAEAKPETKEQAPAKKAPAKKAPAKKTAAKKTAEEK